MAPDLAQLKYAQRDLKCFNILLQKNLISALISGGIALRLVDERNMVPANASRGFTRAFRI